MNETSYMLYDATETKAHVTVGFCVFPNTDRVEIFDSIDGHLYDGEPEVVSKADARKMWRGLVEKGWKRCA